MRKSLAGFEIYKLQKTLPIIKRFGIKSLVDAAYHDLFIYIVYKSDYSNTTRKMSHRI